MGRLLDENDVYALFAPNGTARLHVADIDELPRVDAVEVVHGRWVTHKEHDPDWWGCTAVHFCCSNCMRESNSRAYNYCPNCGAKMDLED